MTDLKNARKAKSLRVTAIVFFAIALVEVAAGIYFAATGHLNFIIFLSAVVMVFSGLSMRGSAGIYDRLAARR